MKKLILIIAIVFSGMLAQAQTYNFSNFKAADYDGNTIYGGPMKQCEVKLMAGGMEVFSNYGEFSDIDQYVFKNDWVYESTNKFGRVYPKYAMAWGTGGSKHIIFFRKDRILIYNAKHKEYTVYYN